MPELARAGAPVGLGSDIARAINLDSLGGLAVAASTAAGTPVSAMEVLRMRTSGAAASIGAADLGELRAGQRADFVVRHPSATQDLGADPHLETAVLGARGTVRTVVVDGVVVVDESVPVGLDPEQVMADARASVRALRQRVGAA
jgi:cytosine/adenosine deaminase-related metal-dependent hydrolase